MKIVSLIIAVVIGISIQAQTPLQQKYNNYKTRLNTKFVIVGPDAGQSIPTTAHKSLVSSDSLNYWGDAGISLGWYIGVLATEYEIKRMNNENYTQTVSELFYALNALNRLDTLAESYYGGTASLNGFVLRDDVSASMIPATNTLNPLFYNANTCVASNYGQACSMGNCLPTTPCTASLENEESQDQFYHLLMGLSLCAKYGNITHSGINLSTEAKAITHRLITYMKQTGWVIKNPITGNDVSRGPNAVAYSNGIAKAGLNVTGNTYSDAVSNGFTAQFAWNTFPTVFTTYDNTHMFLAAAAVANDTRATVDGLASNHGMHIYPLIRQVLYGGPNLINDTVYTNLLNKADNNGNYYYSPSAKSTGGTWYSSNMFVWPDRANMSALGTNTLTFSFGEYPGLDFMLLHNLMELKQLTVGVINYESGADLTIYPNPSNGMFSINTSDNNATNTLLIYSIDGKLMLSKSLAPHQISTAINADELTNGIYIYKITDSVNYYKIGKLVISK